MNSKRIAIVLAGILGILALAGCGDDLTVDRVADEATAESQEVVLYFPRQVDEEEDLTGEITGRLVFEDNCLWIDPEDSDERFVVTWHPEFQSGVDEGVAEVLNAENEIVTKDGDLITLQGREVDDYSGSEPLPPECEDGPFWAAGDKIDLIEIGDEN